MTTKETSYTADTVLDALNKLYDKAISGVKGNGKSPAENMANKYLEKAGGDIYLAAKKLSRTQNYKTFSTGFVSSFGGFLLLPLTLPADLTTSLFIELRMITSIATLGGYDLQSEEVRTLAFTCLIGSNGKKLLKGSGIKLGQKAINKAVAKVPQKVLLSINKKVGIKIFSKIGGKGAIGIGRGLPVLGGFIGGGMNYFYTKYAGKRAIETFIVDQMSESDKKDIIVEKTFTFKRIKEKISNK